MKEELTLKKLKEYSDAILLKTRTTGRILNVMTVGEYMRRCEIIEKMNNDKN